MSRGRERRGEGVRERTKERKRERERVLWTLCLLRRSDLYFGWVFVVFDSKQYSN
jgi:hypothetical protein